MIILLFGVTNVGKSETGRELAKKLGYTFFDMDEEIKRKFQTTLEQFMEDFDEPHNRFRTKGEVLGEIIEKGKDDIVIAVCPIYYPQYFNSYLDRENIVAIELQDSVENIYDRLVFSDENDNVYKDDEYKEKHRDYYLDDIYDDILYAEEIFKKVKNKYFINNKSTKEVSNDLVAMINKISSTEI